MKYTCGIWMLVVIVVLSLGCRKKVVDNSETKVVEKIVTETGDSTQGTESHAGGALVARANMYKIHIGSNSETLQDLNIDDGHDSTLLTFREQVLRFLIGMEIKYNNGKIKDKEVSAIFSKLFRPHKDTKKSIYEDVVELKFDFKVPELGDPLDGPDREYCENLESKTSAMAAGLWDFGGTICVDTAQMAIEGISESEYLHLMIHELCHHFGCNEKEADMLQTYLQLGNNDYEISQAGDFVYDWQLHIVDAFELTSNDLKLRLDLSDASEYLGGTYDTYENLYQEYVSEIVVKFSKYRTYTHEEISPVPSDQFRENRISDKIFELDIPDHVTDRIQNDRGLLLTFLPDFGGLTGEGKLQVISSGNVIQSISFDTAVSAVYIPFSGINPDLFERARR